MRCPGGGSSARRAARPRGERRGEREHRVEVERRSAITSASRSMKASSAACSRACTSPRWRSGSAMSGLRCTAPTTGSPSASTASRTSRSCRGLATWFRTTPGDPHRRVVGGEAAGDRRRGLRLAGDVEDQQHRHAVAPRQVGRRAAAPGAGRRCRRRGPWRSRSTSTSAPAACSPASRSSRPGGIAQLSRLTPGAPGRRGVEARVDVVRPRLRAAHREPAPAPAPASARR